MKKMLLLATTFFMCGCGLQNQINDLKNRANLDESQINAIAKRIQVLEYTVDSTKNQLIALSNANNVTQNTISTLQTQLSTALVQLATLNGYTNVVSVKDPCGAQGTYNELFLKLSNGQYLTTFSQKDNQLATRFAFLTDGNYITNDQTSCNFTVSGNGTVISNEHN